MQKHLAYIHECQNGQNEWTKETTRESIPDVSENKSFLAFSSFISPARNSKGREKIESDLRFVITDRWSCHEGDVETSDDADKG